MALQGEELLGTTAEGGSTARCIVRKVQAPQHAAAAGSKENGAAADGGAAVDGGADSDATDEENEGEKAEKEAEEQQQQPVDPDSIEYVVEWLSDSGAPTGQHASLHRAQLQRGKDSALTKLTKPLLHQWVETVAIAEPVAVRCRLMPG